MMVETMVLRFRDLVAATIAQHRQILGRAGRVWWGWWSKPEEHVPDDAFAQLRGRISPESPLIIFLADSGRQLLYRACVAELQWSRTEHEDPCPDPDLTPEYYRGSRYKAWLCFTQIEDVSEAELRRFAYVEVPGYLDNEVYATESRLFCGKRVFSLDEMLNRRHRTIYFVEAYEPARHRDHRIELVPRVEPADFMRSPLMLSSNYILQLSDIHFGSHHGFALDGDSPRRRRLSTAIVDDLRRNGFGHPAAVVLSGDITWSGDKQEYDWALGLVGTLVSAFSLDRNAIVVVPGNHDIRWTTDDGGNSETSGEVGCSSDQAQRNYHSFCQELLGFAPNKYLSMGRRLVLANYVPVDIVGLNSSQLEQRGFEGHGFISIEQLEGAAREMQWSDPKPKAGFRLLVLHHNLVPVAPKEAPEFDRHYRLTLDAGQVVFTSLELGVDLALHGHTHQPFLSAVSRTSRTAGFPPARTLAIHASGNAGATLSDIGITGKNSYSIIGFDHDGATVGVRSWSEDIDGFDFGWSCRLSRNTDGGLVPIKVYNRKGDMPRVDSTPSATGTGYPA